MDPIILAAIKKFLIEIIPNKNVHLKINIEIDVNDSKTKEHHDITTVQ